MELSTEIKEARRKLGLSQAEAAKLWDIPLPTLRHWEQGQNKPRGFALKHLRGILEAALSADKPASVSLAAGASPDVPSAPPPNLPPSKSGPES